MPPVIGRSVGWIDAEDLDRVDRGEHALDLGPAADAQQDLAAGTDKWQGREASPGAIARTMSMRETTVPKSFDAQRTKAKIVLGAKLKTRRRRSMIFSPTSWPNLIQCSIRFSSQINSTGVRVSDAGAVMTRLLHRRGIRGRADARNMSATVWPAMERRDPDATAHRRRHIDRQPRGELDVRRTVG